MHKQGADLAEIDGHQVRQARARPRVLAGTTVGLALAGVASVLVLSAASSPSAFAVSRNADGTVTVKLQRIAAIHGANAKLAALGIRARLVEVVPGCQVKTLSPAAAQAMTLARSMAGKPAPQAAITRLDPRKIPPGKWQVIPTYPVAGTVHVDTGHLIQGRAPVCISTVAAAPCPAQSILRSRGATPTALANIHRQAAQEALKRFLARHPAVSTNIGNSGNSGNAGNSGSGNAGNSGSGDTGNSGSGDTGNSGTPTSTVKPTQAPGPNWVVGCYVRVPPGHPPITPNSGNSGNSGASGNS